MAQQYRIKIINDSGITQAYYLFQAPPILSPSADIFTNIYGVSPIIQGDGNSSITFTLNDTFYAVNGVPPAGGLHPGVTISSSSHADVALGDSQNNGTLWNLTTSPKDGSPLWLPPPTTVEAPGGFGIKTDSSFQFPDPEAWFLGVGAQDPYDPNSVIPVATVTAHPSDLYLFTPKITFYVCTGSYEKGTVIDVEQVGLTLEVDFTGKTIHDVAYKNTADGKYVLQPSFIDQPPSHEF